MPRSSAALTSIEAFLVAVEAIRRSFGRRSMTARVIGVRSRITQKTRDDGVYVRNVVVKNGDVDASLENGPISH
jgi:hypothetical protein